LSLSAIRAENRKYTGAKTVLSALNRFKKITFRKIKEHILLPNEPPVKTKPADFQRVYCLY